MLTPVIVQSLTDRGLFIRYPKAYVPFQVGLVGLILAFATPLGCSMFSQIASIKVDKLEPELREIIRKTHPKLNEATYNKGL